MGDVSTAFVKQYSDNIMFLAQQKGSKLRNAVRLKTGITGEEAYIDQIGKTAAVKRTTRHQDTPIIDPDHQRRKVFLFDWIHNTLLDKEDEIKMLADPKSPYVQNAVWALGRSMDQEILTAALATAYTGKEGGTSVSFPSGNIVAVGTDGLTIAKLISAKELLDDADVDEDEPRFIAVGAKQISDLLATTQVTSSDYNTVKALVQGQIDTFMGFKFIRVSSSMLTLSSTTRKCIAWAQNGLGLGIASDIKTRISERADKNYATQVFASLGIGATRLDEDRVVEVDCLES